MYLEDALAERVWVDHYDCKGFVDNILTAFNTKLPPKGFLVPELIFKADVGKPAFKLLSSRYKLSSLYILFYLLASSPPTVDIDDEANDSLLTTEGKEALDIAVHPR